MTGLLGFLGARDHLVPASGLHRLIERQIEFELIEDLPIPLHVVAVDVITGEELRLSSGPLLDAVLGGAAIPGVLAPVLTQRRLIDDVEEHRENAQLVVLPPCPLHTQPIDFNHADELIDRALADARKFLDSGGEDRPPIRMARASAWRLALGSPAGG